MDVECAWCSPNAHRAGVSHTICEDCLDANYGKEQDDERACLELIDDAPQVRQHYDRSEGIHAATDYLKQNTAPRPLSDEHPGNAFAGAFNAFCMVLIVGLAALAMWPL